MPIVGECPACKTPLPEATDRCPNCGLTAPAEDDRPWERLGAARLDCEPARGKLLLNLGLLAALAGFSALFTFIGSLVALPLGGAVWHFARRDLDEIGRGLRDPRGRAETRDALTYGRAAVVLAAVAWVGWGVLLSVVLAWR